MNGERVVPKLIKAKHIPEKEKWKKKWNFKKVSLSIWFWELYLLHIKKFQQNFLRFAIFVNFAFKKCCRKKGVLPTIFFKNPVLRISPTSFLGKISGSQSSLLKHIFFSSSHFSNIFCVFNNGGTNLSPRQNITWKYWIKSEGFKEVEATVLKFVYAWCALAFQVS